MMMKHYFFSIMGDFNAHGRIIGKQTINYNGKIVLDIMTENNIIMLNYTDKCKGTYTWSRGQSRIVIDFVIVNSLSFRICDQMEIDEQQEKIDLTDHNLFEISLKLNNMHPNYVRRGKWEEKIYYKLDEKSIEKYITQMEKDINTHNDIPIEEFNKRVGKAADKTLMSKYKRRLLKNNQTKSGLMMKLKREKNLTEKGETVMKLQKGNCIINCILNRKQWYKLK